VFDERMEEESGGVGRGRGGEWGGYTATGAL